MVAVPAVEIPLPVIIPEIVPAVATPVLLLLHVPPVTASVSVVTAPPQMLAPLMADGSGYTVTVVVAGMQPAPVA